MDFFRIHFFLLFIVLFVIYFYTFIFFYFLFIFMFYFFNIFIILYIIFFFTLHISFFALTQYPVILLRTYISTLRSHILIVTLKLIIRHFIDLELMLDISMCSV